MGDFQEPKGTIFGEVIIIFSLFCMKNSLIEIERDRLGI
jgi:hypothetical protein